jgi:predicted acylesterase/phospholipase RssA
MEQEELATAYRADGLCRILALDGGGAKGFYTLGVLKEIEAMLKCRLHQRFDLIFGTSTGAIIASLLALRNTVDEIHHLYKSHVPAVMKERKRRAKSQALARLASEVFGHKSFTDVKTGIGIVATRWVSERPMIFKDSVDQAHGRKGTFTPGFGVSIADAVQGSCSAFPFFDRKLVSTSTGDNIELIDGGYCANNPTLYAIADAVRALKKDLTDIRVVSVGVGVYPEPKGDWKIRLAKKYLASVQLLQKTLEMDVLQLSGLLAGDVKESQNDNPIRDLQMASDRGRPHTPQGASRWVAGDDLLRQIQFIDSLFDLAA